MVSNANTQSEQGRLNLLLGYAGWRTHNWADQLPQLLDPMGINSFRVRSGSEATGIINTTRIDIAVVDLGLPLEAADDQATPSSAQSQVGGTRLLQILRRLDSPPPTVVVRPAAGQVANERTLRESLAQGAFTVLDTPVQIEHVLEIMRRILRRYHANTWPTGQ